MKTFIATIVLSLSASFAIASEPNTQVETSEKSQLHSIGLSLKDAYTKRRLLKERNASPAEIEEINKRIQSLYIDRRKILKIDNFDSKQLAQN